MIRGGIVFFALAVLAAAQGGPLAGGEYFPAQHFQAQAGASSDSDYQKGLRELDARQWDEAIASFAAASEHEKSGVQDGALYWKAYAAYHAGRYEDALDAISDLRSDYPSSRWVKDAQALSLEVRAQMGAPVSPGAEHDDDLKLIALNGLMQSDPDKALPILEKLLAGSDSEKVKERALFVLTQTGSPAARKMLMDLARNSSTPGLQKKAIQFLGMMGGADAQKDLISIYKSTSDTAVKRDVLRSFMQTGARSFLLEAAKTEQNPELRRDAIRQLAMTGAQDELWQLYETSPVEEKKDILQSMFLSGNSTRLEQIARSEKDPSLRAAAIRSLGLMGGRVQASTLVSIYESDSNPQVREAVLNALFLQQDGKDLVALARSEKDPQMKKRIVEKMALVHSKETTDYMMELLK